MTNLIPHQLVPKPTFNLAVNANLCSLGNHSPTPTCRSHDLFAGLSAASSLNILDTAHKARYVGNKARAVTLFFFLLITLPSLAVPLTPQNFEEAKSIARRIWQEHRETFYCGCSYDRHGVINFDSCDFIPSDKRKNRVISWEHVVPVSWYGKHLPCWKEPICTTSNGKKYRGRNCCQKIDPLFRQMESDLHNLVPAIREVNFARENYRFGEFYLENKGEKFKFHHCDLIIDDHYRLVEPKDEIKGMVARISLYMADKYAINLGNHQKRLLTHWNHRFPPTDWEKKWDQKVAEVQGDFNTYISE